MFRNDALVRPQLKSVLFTLIVAAIAYLASLYSPAIGYWLAILTLLAIGFISNSIWPTKGKRENPYLFSLFWGLIIGMLLPFLITKVANEGIASLLNLIIE